MALALLMDKIGASIFSIEWGNVFTIFMAKIYQKEAAANDF